MLATHLEVVERNSKPAGSLPPMNTAVETALIEYRREFQRYLDRRIGNESAAEDVFQTFCLRAVVKGRELRDNERVVAWLYSVLRSVLADHYRSEAARQRRDASYAQEQLVLGNDRVEIELDEKVCSCFHDLMPALRSEHEEVLRRVDMSDERRENVAADLGITPENLRVRLHRARQAMRKALGNCCGSCCEYSFRECTS